MRKIAECDHILTHWWALQHGQISVRGLVCGDDDGTLIRQVPFSSSLHCTRGIPFSGTPPQQSNKGEGGVLTRDTLRICQIRHVRNPLTRKTLLDWEVDYGSEEKEL